MSKTRAPEDTAEKVLRRLQRRLLEQAGAKPLSSQIPWEAETVLTAEAAPRRALRGLEAAWGVSATREGRWLSELLQGSAVWEIVERPQPGGKRRDVPPLPRPHEISHCEPVLRVMRESGELAERERLLNERDIVLCSLGGDHALPEAERQQAARAVYDRYFADVADLARKYRPVYREMRRAPGAVPSLTGPRVRSLPFLQPPLLARLFAACHAGGGDFFSSLPPPPPEHGEEPFAFTNEYRSGRQVVTMRAAPGTPGLLDEMAWDVATVAVCAFFARTAGRDPQAWFPLLIDDYFEWRGVDPRKRTTEARRQVDARVRMLCAPERLLLDTESELWLPISEDGGGQQKPQQQRRRRTALATQGAFLARRSGLFRPSPWVSETQDEPLYGHLVSLGDWARPFLEAGAMMGVSPKKLAEYDLRRQQWERRIGWYLTFQMQNQGAKMTFHGEEAKQSPKAPANVTPQHSLRMKTVLQNSHVAWEEMAHANPGKVIRQWVDALETLRRDAIVGDYSCLDGAPDGSDLPTRNRLSMMLNHRYLFTPGGDLAERLRRKSARRAAE